MAFAMRLRQAMMLECAICGRYYDGDTALEHRTLVAIAGIKSGWRLCRCAQSAIAKINGRLVARDDFEVWAHWPDADPWITVCPPGAAANALVWP